MSYEQKYLKYKQKYQELKKQFGGVHLLETENNAEEFNLTDTPTYEPQLVQKGGNNIEMDIDYTLTDTPTFAQNGGSMQESCGQQGGSLTLSPASFNITPPLESCMGVVNPQPNVAVPIPPPQPPVIPMAVILEVNSTPDMAVNNKNLVNGAEELNSTTELSEIQNTEEIEKLFNQFGGKHISSSSSSSSSNSDSDSDSLSDFDDSISLSD